MINPTLISSLEKFIENRYKKIERRLVGDSSVTLMVKSAIWTSSTNYYTNRTCEREGGVIRSFEWVEDCTVNIVFNGTKRTQKNWQIKYYWDIYYIVTAKEDFRHFTSPYTATNTGYWVYGGTNFISGGV